MRKEWYQPAGLALTRINRPYSETSIRPFISSCGPQR